MASNEHQLRHASIFIADAVIDIPDDWQSAVEAMLRDLADVATAAGVDYRIRSIRNVRGLLDVRDNIQRIEASQAFKDYVKATIAYSSDRIDGVLERVRARWKKPMNTR